MTHPTTAAIWRGMEDLQETSPSTDIHHETFDLIKKLEDRYAEKIVIDPRLTRKAVSFQANKTVPVLRWYKYKEGFSGDLVKRYLDELNFPRPTVLDPFVGSGTTLAACAERGVFSEGIELLPVGQLLCQVRLDLAGADLQATARRLNGWIRKKPWLLEARPQPVPHLRITECAYPADTERKIGQFLTASAKENEPLRSVLKVALLSVLEAVSFTRKDGQYLRWDYRSGRTQLKSKFDKGQIHDFDHAIVKKLTEIADDLGSLPAMMDEYKNDLCRLHSGSCLTVLPTLPADYFGGVITSPPYCNRYDYTRTYALEHALLGVTELETKRLRQAMLTCTVENRQKELLKIKPDWIAAITACRSVEALTAIINSLARQSQAGTLNNPNIVRMIDGYFVEMACVIYEMARVLMQGGKAVMVNDNVRYGGIDIPVDCILSDIAACLGLETVQISTLPRGKGNSSQQMGAHGRRELRKSVYIWEKQ